MSVRNNSLELFTLIEDLIPPRLKEECIARFDTYCNRSILYKTPSLKDVSLASLENGPRVVTPKDVIHRTPSLKDISTPKESFTPQEAKSSQVGKLSQEEETYQNGETFCKSLPPQLEEIGNLPNFLSPIEEKSTPPTDSQTPQKEDNTPSLQTSQKEESPQTSQKEESPQTPQKEESPQTLPSADNLQSPPKEESPQTPPKEESPQPSSKEENIVNIIVQTPQAEVKTPQTEKKSPGLRPAHIDIPVKENLDIESSTSAGANAIRNRLPRNDSPRPVLATRSSDSLRHKPAPIPEEVPENTADPIDFVEVKPQINEKRITRLTPSSERGDPVPLLTRNRPIISGLSPSSPRSSGLSPSSPRPQARSGTASINVAKPVIKTKSSDSQGIIGFQFSEFD
jgi:hypothetical protein